MKIDLNIKWFSQAMVYSNRATIKVPTKTCLACKKLGQKAQIKDQTIALIKTEEFQVQTMEAVSTSKLVEPFK